MKRIHIVGRKNHGKTALIVDLLRELPRRSLCAGTIKHSSNLHELDTPGKDSFRQRQAGANPTAIVTNDLIGLYVCRDAKTDFYDQLAAMFTGCDLVLVEGDLDGAGVKIEVWREAVGGACLASQRPDIAAVVSDDRPKTNVPIWPRRDIVQLVDHILALLETR